MTHISIIYFIPIHISINWKIPQLTSFEGWEFPQKVFKYLIFRLKFNFFLLINKFQRENMFTKKSSYAIWKFCESSMRGKNAHFQFSSERKKIKLLKTMKSSIDFRMSENYKINKNTRNIISERRIVNKYKRSQGQHL